MINTKYSAILLQCTLSSQYILSCTLYNVIVQYTPSIIHHVIFVIYYDNDFGLELLWFRHWNYYDFLRWNYYDYYHYHSNYDFDFGPLYRNENAIIIILCDMYVYCIYCTNVHTIQYNVQMYFPHPSNHRDVVLGMDNRQWIWIGLDTGQTNGQWTLDKGIPNILMTILQISLQ